MSIESWSTRKAALQKGMWFSAADVMKICEAGIALNESLANFRWVGMVPEELQDLTWLEELLIA
jgi:hypothetical protein